MNFQTRLAASGDRDIINFMMRTSLAYWKHGDDYVAQFMNKLAVTDEYMQKHPIHLLYANEQLCGFFCFKVEDAELDSLFILPEFIGKGLGRLAWNAVCDYAKQYQVTEFVIYSQPGSEAFYLKMGCEKIREQKSFIKAGMMIPILMYRL